MTEVESSYRKALLDRRRILLEQPDVRWIQLVETDGVNTTTRRHLVRFHRTKNVDHLKNQLTQTLQPTIGAVRNIYTPANGTLVSDLSQIQSQKTYVVGMGNQKYAKIKELLREHEENKRKILAQLARQKSQSRGSPAGSNSETPTIRRSVFMPANRMSLIDRQDMIAQRARENAIEANNAAKIELTRRPPPPNVPKAMQYRGPRKIIPNRRPLFPARRTSATQTPPKKRSSIGGKFRKGGQAILMSNNGKKGVNGIIAPIPVPMGRISRKSTGKKSESDRDESDKSGSRSRSGSKSDNTVSRDDSAESRKSSRSGSNDSNSTRKSSRSPSSRHSGSKTRSISRDSADSGLNKSNKSSSRSKNLTVRSGRSSAKSNTSRGSSKTSRNSTAKSEKSRASSAYSKRSRASSEKSNRSKTSTAKSRDSRDSSAHSERSRTSSMNSGKSRASSSHSYKSKKSSVSATTNGTAASRRSKSSARSNMSNASSTRKRGSTRKSTATSRNSDEVVDGDSDTDDEKGKSRRLRYGSRFAGGSAKSHRLEVHAKGNGALNDSSPDKSLLSPVKIPDRNKSPFLFSAYSSRPDTRNLVEVDFDTDKSGIYRAKSTRSETLGAKEILDTSRTKVNFPIDLLPAEEIIEKLHI